LPFDDERPLVLARPFELARLFEPRLLARAAEEEDLRDAGAFFFVAFFLAVFFAVVFRVAFLAVAFFLEEALLVVLLVLRALDLRAVDFFLVEDRDEVLRLVDVFLAEAFEALAIFYHSIQRTKKPSRHERVGTTVNASDLR
jgi:hypothetical protein